MMLWEEIKNINSSKEELKKFGLTIGAVLLLIGGALFYYEKSNYFYFLSAAAFFGAFGLAFPKILLPFHKFWMAFAAALGFVMTRVILSILFYLVFTPMSLIAKLAGKKFLDQKIDKNVSTYWHYREKKEYKKIDTERQF
jgi:Na+(H+)/acetate symporter ActP